METLTRLRLFMIIALAGLFAGCSGDSGFSLGGEENVFQQSVTQTQVKVDILWVIDNSGSMATSQAALANNVQSFIGKFQQTNFDFQMAVTTTDAWLSKNQADPNDIHTLARFRDGTDATSHTGVTVIKPDTPNLEATFITNVLQGVNGTGFPGAGDERGMESLQAALDYADNANEPFPRQNSLLAVIVLSDEEDGSADTDQDYFDYLYNLSNSTQDNLNFMFNTIAILDQTCLDELTTPTFLGRQIGQRYINLSDMSGGYKGSLCDPFDDVMSGIADLITEKSTAFKLNRQPAIDTIEVKIDGVVIPMDPVNGWTYDPATMLITFHGSSIPGPGASVSITFDPEGLK